MHPVFRPEAVPPAGTQSVLPPGGPAVPCSAVDSAARYLQVVQHCGPGRLHPGPGEQTPHQQVPSLQSGRYCRVERSRVPGPVRPAVRPSPRPGAGRCDPPARPDRGWEHNIAGHSSAGITPGELILPLSQPHFHLTHNCSRPPCCLLSYHNARQTPGVQ